MEVFGSPLKSPSEFTLEHEGGYKLSNFPKYELDTDSEVIRDVDSSLVEDKRKKELISTPLKFPYIQLTSHANICTPVQSDSTNRVISSSSKFATHETSLAAPYLHGAEQHHFSSPVEFTNVQTQPSSFAFSPPLTRSAARR